MLFDWFTVVAQIINFLVLILLLRYFLYGRIVQAMDRREKKIAARLEEAEEKRKEAEQGVETYQKKIQEIEERREQVISGARQEAEAQKKELLRKAREEVDQIQKRWQESVQRKKDLFLQDLKQRAGQQIYAIARRILRELAHAELERQIINVFLKRLQELGEEKRQEIAEEISRAEKRVVIHSAFEISAEDREKVTQAVQKYIGDGIEVQYQILPDLILGIELKADGHKIAWSLDHFMESLEARIAEAIAEEKGELQEEKRVWGE